MAFRCCDASMGQRNKCILCNFIAEFSHIESLDDTVGALCFCGGNMKFLIRKECLHYWQKENKKNLKVPVIFSNLVPTGCTEKI